MRTLGVFAFALLSLLLVSNAYAYYNITYTNTTVILNNNQSAHVIEQFSLFVSNASLSQYASNRNAVGVSLSYWQKIIYTSTLQEHIVSSAHSIYGFEFLPGPLVTIGNNGSAVLTMNYYINNITSVMNTAPRKFEYSFNNTFFNFENTANGQTLPYNTRLNLIVSKGDQVVTLYPLPDSPGAGFAGNYTNVTEFSWYSGEPLSSFSFSYITTQSLQNEVVSYFTGIYTNYTTLVYIAVLAIIVFVGVYIYRKTIFQNLT